MYSVSFVLLRLYKQFNKPDLKFVFANSTGIFTAKPFYVDNGVLGYLNCSIESYDAISFENIRYSENQASEFDKFFRDAHIKDGVTEEGMEEILNFIEKVKKEQEDK